MTTISIGSIVHQCFFCGRFVRLHALVKLNAAMQPESPSSGPMNYTHLCICGASIQYVAQIEMQVIDEKKETA